MVAVIGGFLVSRIITLSVERQSLDRRSRELGRVHTIGGGWGMEITKEQYERVAGCFPVQRGNVKVSNLQILNAILYVAEHGCKWRGLPSRFGRWHTVYTRMNRWSKNGVLDRVFEQLQREQIIRVKVETVLMDSTIVKVHPDGTGALKKGVRS